MIDALFGSKTRVKLLKLFFNNPDNAYYVRELTREIDEQINSIRRELKNLLEVGVIRSKAVKNQLYYEVNKEFELYKPFEQIFTGKTIRKTQKRDNTNEFAELGDVKIVIQAGKFVGNPEQGVDLVVAGYNINQTRLKALVKKLEEISGEINYTTMGYQDFVFRKSIKDPFISGIIDKKHNVLIDTEKLFKED